MGIGANTCGEFAQAYRQATASETVYFTWAQGFMTGLNTDLLRSQKKFADMNAMSLNTQEAFLHNYSSENPLKEYFVGVVDLYKSLPVKDYVAH